MCVAVLMTVVDSPKGGGGGGARGVCVCVCAVCALRVVGVPRSEGACATRVRRMARAHARASCTSFGRRRVGSGGGARARGGVPCLTYGWSGSSEARRRVPRVFAAWPSATLRASRSSFMDPSTSTIFQNQAEEEVSVSGAGARCSVTCICACGKGDARKRDAILDARAPPGPSTWSARGARLSCAAVHWSCAQYYPSPWK